MTDPQDTQRETTDGEQADDTLMEALEGGYSVSEILIILAVVVIGGVVAAVIGVRLVGIHTTMWEDGLLAAGFGIVLVCLYTTVAYVVLSLYWSLVIQVVAYWRGAIGR